MIRTAPIDPASLDELVRSRFYVKVAAPDSNGCQLWTGAVRKTNGYGQFAVPGRGMVSAHRVAFVLATGEDIPPGMMIDHLCRVRHCVAPAHLRVVTNRENLHAEGSLHWARSRAQQTHCQRGHPLEENNLNPLQLRRGRRQCQACMTAWNRLSERRTRTSTEWTEAEMQAESDAVYHDRGLSVGRRPPGRASQKRCKRGHSLLDESNLRPGPFRRGQRVCAACATAQDRLRTRQRRDGVGWTADELQMLSDEVFAERAQLLIVDSATPTASDLKGNQR